MRTRIRKISRILIVLLAATSPVSMLPSAAIAADNAATQHQSAPAGGARPLLQQLNEETQSLYQEVQAGVVRVQLPPPRWAGERPLADDNPLRKWNEQLEPAMKQQLEREQKD